MGEQFRLKKLIRPVISFDPNPSIRIVSWGLAIFIMSCHPTPPAIIMARDPNFFPRVQEPIHESLPSGPEHIPVAEGNDKVLAIETQTLEVEGERPTGLMRLLSANGGVLLQLEEW